LRAFHRAEVGAAHGAEFCGGGGVAGEGRGVNTVGFLGGFAVNSFFENER
jgi:hypothetical protein